MKIKVYVWADKEYQVEFGVYPKEAPHFLGLYEMVEDQDNRLVTIDYLEATKLVGGEMVMRRLEDDAYDIAADREYDAWEEEQLRRADAEKDERDP